MEGMKGYRGGNAPFVQRHGRTVAIVTFRGPNKVGYGGGGGGGGGGDMTLTNAH
jgi:hypothetical protein